ncbi:hypothetical protein [Flexilinea flocculi]|uniref:Uncharacterized protein n=1 Tax=Flexilinea flocculi TaxID=1678840 RepID=A0A0S7BQ58_9CHLR|nr:hypothetical protein [Flexilinea flocculi]NMB93772.1 hypothetical protein [Flexilinea flocculi]GAP40375.1 hypothetical protein ATC1_13348 [Flexilinea flocculi]
MTIPLFLILVCALIVIGLNNLRPLTLKKWTISPSIETGMTLLICIVFVGFVFFLLYFLIFGLISWIPAKTAEKIWLIATILMLLSGMIGVLLLREKRKGNLSMICFLTGYLSLFFFIMGNYISEV